MTVRDTLLSQADALCQQHDTRYLTVEWTSDGVVVRDDGGDVIPGVPDTFLHAVDRAADESIAMLRADIADVRAAHPEDWGDDEGLGPIGLAGVTR